MAAAVWTACTKLLFYKKMRSPEASQFASGFCFFWRFFEGVSGKSGVFKTVFGGEIVVNCMVKMVVKQHVFQDAELRQCM
jgi:hypothetical protein